MEMPRLKLKLHLASVPILILALAATASAWVDLKLESVHIYSPPAGYLYGPGGRITLSASVFNLGDETSAPFTADCYVSTDAQMTPSDYYIGSRVLAGVKRTQRSAFTVSCRLPVDLPLGDYATGMIITCPNDTNSYNNVRSGSPDIHVVTSCPDLAIQSVDAAEGCYRPGDSITISATIKNVGRLDSADSCVHCYASTDPTAVASGFPLGSTDVGPLEPGERTTIVQAYQFPAHMPEGDYYIGLEIVCSGDLAANNNVGHDTEPVWVGPFADLAMQSVDAADGTCSPGAPIMVRTLVENVGDRDSGTYSVDYYLSLHAEITRTDNRIGSADGGSLAPGEQCSQETTCQLPSYVPAGRCYIGAIVTCPNDLNPRNDMGIDPVPVTAVFPALYVCGRMQYRHADSWPFPIRYARVRVYDVDGNSDPLDDRVIGEAYTDQNGNYGTPILNDEHSGTQIYVKVFTEVVPGALGAATSTVGTVRDDVFDKPYALKSPAYPYPRDASLTVSLTGLNTDGEFMVFDSIIEGFCRARQFCGFEPNGITTYWPSSDGGTYYRPDRGIFIARDDRADRDVIMHEYGHYVAEICDFAQGDVGDNPRHYWNLDHRLHPSLRTEEQARRMAFREAWATFFSVATQYRDSSYPDSGDSMYQDRYEAIKVKIQIDLDLETRLHYQPGEYYENMNCAALWDIFDDYDDPVDNQDTLSDLSLSKIRAVLTEARPADMRGFWSGWFDRHRYIREMLRIFGDHGMPFRYSGPVAVVETFETGDFSTLAWTHPGDAPWTVTVENCHRGAYSARAGAIGDSQSSILTITMACDPTDIKFWYKVSSDEGFDKLQFAIDGRRCCEWSGAIDWRQLSYPVTAGTHTFTWTYKKDYCDSRGADAAWIDDIEFPVWDAPQP